MPLKYVAARTFRLGGINYKLGDDFPSVHNIAVLIAGGSVRRVEVADAVESVAALSVVEPVPAEPDVDESRPVTVTTSVRRPRRGRNAGESPADGQ